MNCPIQSKRKAIAKHCTLIHNKMHYLRHPGMQRVPLNLQFNTFEALPRFFIFCTHTRCMCKMFSAASQATTDSWTLDKEEHLVTVLKIVTLRRDQAYLLHPCSFFIYFFTAFFRSYNEASSIKTEKARSLDGMLHQNIVKMVS